MRVYEFAKLLNISNKELIELLTKEGFEVKSHMSALSEEAVNFLNKQMQARSDAEKQLQVTKKSIIEPTQMHVSKQKVPIVPKQDSHVQVVQPEKIIVKPEIKEVPQEFIVEPMSIGDAAQKMNKPVNELILILLKQGIVSAKNQILPASTIEQLARHYQFVIKHATKEKKQEVKRVVVSSREAIRRLPVVVVVGHVDHGKTTLLDFIRSTRLAAKEKGGITQHLGAYEVSTSHGNLIFLDTPGHEAFSNIRGRGLKVADIAILVIAADDGIMPQTIEAIKRAQATEVPVIVAINKIDKVDASRIEVVRRELARYNLMPEEWGGTTVCVPISAKTGKGVDHLLEMLVLQTELMDLKADPAKSAVGFVLESRLEKRQRSCCYHYLSRRNFENW